MSRFSENEVHMLLNETIINPFDFIIGELQEQRLSLNLEKEKIRKYKSRTERYRINTILRVVFSAVYTGILAYWLYSVLHIVQYNNLYYYKLSDHVLLGLLATTTANVIGLVVIVLKNLFPMQSGNTNALCSKI
ncbi:hypothetical protein E6C50_08730 [Flavobacterium supellecticarium]|uniref:Uncharacterized protein n=1 Tax=Flavobacterium supellecticarium TaxID=2565924 RepID=A0A4V3W8N1_9FLAO|nr:hypothetical protein [Flavobacterium supellecticarium]THF51830.1 hypothetical protein E6C50_08730 [Flavobacterium supellecticarium]